MSSLKKNIFYGIILVLAVFAVWGCSQPTSDDPAEPVTWTAQADGGETAASSKIDFVFSKEVTGLTADDIIVTDGTGSAAKSALTGSGIEWSLAVSVATAGDVTVFINKDGVDNGEQTVAVHKAPLIVWSALADGVDGTTDSTAISFTFDKAIADLTADNITITEDTGRVAKGELAGSGTSWSLTITVETAGDVAVSITKEGIETGTKKVAVYKAGQITVISWSAHADGIGGTSDSTAIAFSFSGEVPGLTVDNITVEADTGSVIKGTLTGSGTEWSLGIAVEAAGDLIVGIQKDGVEIGTKKVAVYKAGQIALLSWDVQANGAEGASNSTAIVFAFSGAVAELNANSISIADDTGSVVKGELSGSGTSWSLGIAVNTAGTIKIKINKEGIEAAEKTLAVHKAPDIGYSTAADGSATATSTAIIFTFEAAVEGLTAEEVTVTNDTGEVTKGSLAVNSGTSYSLGITVNTAGNVKLAITKAGIESAEKIVAVYKAPVTSDITYSAAANGNATASSTAITITFSAELEGLTEDQISLTNDTGDVTKAALSGSGTSYSLGIAVNTPGNVKLAINKEGIESAEKSVAVYKFIPVSYTAAANGNATTTSTQINFAFGTAVAGLVAGDISVTNDTGAIAKGTLSGSGTSYSLGITVTTAGNVKVKINNKPGIEAEEKVVAVYKAPIVDTTYSVLADGVDNTTTSTKIDFSFTAAVAGLSAEQIIVTNDAGSVTKGALTTNSDTSWSLGIAVITAGNIKVKIDKTGVEAAEKTLAVHKAPVVNNDITYSALADGSATATSTKIDFTFTAAVAGLTKEQISVAPVGSVTLGNLTGSNTSYSLAITAVNTAGHIKITIIKPGIEAAEKSVAVYKFIPLAYTASADGGSRAASTIINFAFATALENLGVGNISVTNDTGVVEKGTSLAGSGTSWSLGITVASAGNVKVKIINKAEVENTEKIVTVYKPASYTAKADGSSKAVSTKIDFVFNADVSGLSKEQITVAPDNALTLGTLSGAGRNWSLEISAVNTQGGLTVAINKDGIENTAKGITVYKPIAYTVAADGGSRTTASAKIDFEFSADVSGLSKDQITVAPNDALALGDLSGAGRNWSLEISAVNTPGGLTVAINKDGIENAEKSVTVYQQPVAYTVVADGSNTAVSTHINFTFTASPGLLTAQHITVTDGAGEAAKVGLSGSDLDWSLEIAVAKAGTVTVAINKDGITNAEKSVTVFKPIAYDAVADGDNTTTSTKIDFAFSADVSLEADNITLTDGADSGSATKGSLSMSDEQNWSLEIVVTKAGTVKLAINKAGIEAVEKELTVYIAGPTFTEELEFGTTANSSDVDIGELSGDGAAADMAISAAEKGGLYPVG
jgi:hypothetical protein